MKMKMFVYCNKQLINKTFLKSELKYVEHKILEEKK